MKVVKIMLAILFLQVSYSACANDNGGVVYRNYDRFEYDILRQFKDSGFVSTFTSMPELKRRAMQLQDNQPVNATVLKESKKALTGVQLVKDRSESALLICRYSPKLVENECVKIGASAIIVSEDGICISNYHVFQSIIEQSVPLSPLDSVYFVATQSGKIYGITSVLAFSRTADIAVFKIDLRGDKVPAIPLGHDLMAGEPINAITHPIRHYFYYSRGVVARTICSDENQPFTNRAEITADYAKGSSGGPLMDDNGNLAGMVTATQSIYYEDYPQTSLQMVVKSIIPVSTIRLLLNNK